MAMISSKPQPTQLNASQQPGDQLGGLHGSSTVDLRQQGTELLPLSLREQHRRRQASVARGGALISGGETLGQLGRNIIGARDTRNWDHLTAQRGHNRTLVDRSASLGRDLLPAYGTARDEAQEQFLDDVLARAYANSHRKLPVKRELPANWEAKLPNDRQHYESSPVAQHTQRNGSLSPDRYHGRSFNRKMKMKDTFTRVLGTYNHFPKSCYSQAASHMLHTKYEKDLEDRPVQQIDRMYTHKIDPIKNYSEEMYKLGVFAPAPRKSVAKPSK